MNKNNKKEKENLRNKNINYENINNVEVLDNVKNIDEMFLIKGLSKTKTRTIIGEIFLKEVIPISAEGIFNKILEKGETIDLSTIYRNIKIFEKKDIIRKSFILNGEYYYELFTKKHKHYIICENCNNVEVLKDICFISKYAKKIEDETDFQILDHDLTLYGRCVNCKEKD